MNARMLWLGWVLLVLSACSGGGDKSNASSSATTDSLDETSSTLADIDAETSSTLADIDVKTSSTTADTLTTGGGTAVDVVAVGPPTKPLQAFLAKRSDSWVKNRPCALSCHTTVPFLMLDASAGGDSLASAENIIGRVNKRVDDWPNVQPFYPGQPQATEAVLNAIALVNHDVRRKKPLSATTCKALKAMWQAQRSEGGFGWWAFKLHPFELGQSDFWGGALVSLTLAMVPQPTDCDAALPTAPGLAKLHAWLAGHYTKTDHHGRIWWLLADRAWKATLVSGETRSKILATLRATQRADGGFGLRDFLPLTSATRSDAYASAIMGVLLAAETAAIDQAVASQVKAWMTANGSLEKLQQSRSPNKPDNSFNNKLFSDTSIGYFLWYRQSTTP